MAVGPDPLERATDALREQPDDEWPAVRTAVHHRVGRLVRPSPTLLTRGADGAVERDSAGSRTLVSARVVVAVLRERLTTTRVAPRDVRLVAEDDECVGVAVDLVAAYGADLPAAGTATSETVRSVLGEVLGPVAADAPVDVTVVDVVLGDPRTS